MSDQVETVLLITALLVSTALMAMRSILPPWVRFVLALPAAGYVLYISTTMQHPIWVFLFIGAGMLVVFVNARDLVRSYRG